MGNPVDSIQIMNGMSLNADGHTSHLTFATTGSCAMAPGDYILGMYYRPAGKTWFEACETSSYTNIIHVTVLVPTAVPPGNGCSIHNGIS